MRKPAMLRVYGRVSVIGTRAFDMVSDGTNFTLYIPSKNKAVKGSNSLKKKSTNQMENMRPGFFFDAMVVRGLEKDDLLFGDRGYRNGGGRGQEAPVHGPGIRT